MIERLLPPLGIAHRREDDLHVEFPPTFLRDLERRGLDHLFRSLSKRLVQEVGCFLEAIGGHIVPFGTHEVDADVPAAHGEALDIGRLVDDVLAGDKLHGTLDLFAE